MKNEFILKTLLSHVAKGDYASFRELFDIQYATVNRFVYFCTEFISVGYLMRGNTGGKSAKQ